MRIIIFLLASLLFFNCSFNKKTAISTSDIIKNKICVLDVSVDTIYQIELQCSNFSSTGISKYTLLAGGSFYVPCQIKASGNHSKPIFINNFSYTISRKNKVLYKGIEKVGCFLQSSNA